MREFYRDFLANVSRCFPYFALFLDSSLPSPPDDVLLLRLLMQWKHSQTEFTGLPAPIFRKYRALFEHSIPALKARSRYERRGQRGGKEA